MTNETKINYTQHKHYEAAKRAYYATSFSPDKRAESECSFYDEIMQEFESLGVSEEGKQKFERFFTLSLYVKSRCMSSMITGPANFPIRRAENANNRDKKVSDEMLAYIARVRKAVDKQNNQEKYAIAIRSDDENAVDKLKKKMAKLEKAQEQMKACNKIIKDKKDNKIERLAEILGTKQRAEELMQPDWCGRIGFASFDLTNNNAAIKVTKNRIEQLEKAATLETKEIEIAGVKVVQNAELMRIQFFFDEKPERAVIDLMKKRGFKWSPSNVCWQRLWNNNAIFTIEHYIAPELQKLLTN